MVCLKTKTLFVCILLILVERSFNRRLTDPLLFSQCHQDKCNSRFRSFNCECENEDWKTRPQSCIPSTWLCDGWMDCDDGSDEMDCNCTEQEMFQCSWCSGNGGCGLGLLFSVYQCVPLEKVNNSEFECLSSKDEVIHRSDCKSMDIIKCDGVLTCPLLVPREDEENCTSCPEALPIRCDCNKPDLMACSGWGNTCYSEEQRCDKVSNCIDSSDEVGCECKSNETKCQCYRNNPPTCLFDQACIPNEKHHDGVPDCPDGSDEVLSFRHVQFGSCNVTLYRLNNVLECFNIGYPACDNATCFETPSLECITLDCNATDTLCTSHCLNDTSKDYNHPFQCSDGSLVLTTQYCDNIVDCPDNSDEIIKQHGFKCIKERDACILPQRNLYDDVPHCGDDSDLCFSGNGSCFECFDKRLLISSKQVCDGVIDCFDVSDECLCENNIEKPICNAIFSFRNDLSSQTCNYDRIANQFNSSMYEHNPDLLYALIQEETILNLTHFLNEDILSFAPCRTKYGFIHPALCDGRPECRDFSDECNCENPPKFCEGKCGFIFPMGDRYCNGVEDEAWRYINDSSCPPGFDEEFCPKRFYCKAKGKISIDVSLLCNDVLDCDDGSDENEQNCPRSADETIFSSQTELIASHALKYSFWIIGFIVILGNIFVIITTSRFLCTAKVSDSIRCQHAIILNISIADFIMGIYLLVIASFSVKLAGSYGEVDRQWRSSLRCSIIGSLAVISSEVSCFLMVTLTAFRMYTVCNPIASLSSPIWPWTICICLCWLVAVTLGFAPILNALTHYFVHKVLFLNQFNMNGIWNRTDLMKFACRYARKLNGTLELNNDWESTRSFLEENFPENAPLREFGYYGETSVCMPRFYLAIGNSGWEYSLAIITINLLSFVFIALGYILIYLRSTRISTTLRRSGTTRQESIMQKRIFRIIATDFACWIPICIMTYVRIGGIDFSTIAYQVSAVFLLPINSALNPFLFTSLPDKLIEKIRCITRLQTVTSSNFPKTGTVTQ